MSRWPLIAVFIHLASVANVIHGYPEYIALIPNGLNLVDPCHPEITWHGVGHLNPDGGGALNVFGIDFVTACRYWSQELCQKDSDGVNENDLQC
ncbi:temptin [Plakobranchus ocellatus]|uniref:Temptin n=1 Tax=Plakobranchus ocellatus TaxID=259542 RepID=A0AAV3ZLX1_9GAST|nr:temptin [Plakobranchus ocellatus]